MSSNIQKKALYFASILFTIAFIIFFSVIIYDYSITKALHGFSIGLGIISLTSSIGFFIMARTRR
jgi:hypothetical protein